MHRTVKLFTETGKRKYLENIKLTRFVKKFIVCLVIKRPGIYLHEVKQLLLEYTGIDMQESTICKTLKACGLCQQKNCIRG